MRDRPPVVSLVAPAPGGTYREGEDVKIGYTVADDDGIIGIAGLSGGGVKGTLPSSGPKLDTSGEKALTVWAPIVSKGEEPTVGIVARDTAGQTGSDVVRLNVTKDVEPPSAVMTAPLQPTPAPIPVRSGGSLGVVVNVGADVRVARVAVLVDGVESRTAEEKDWLTVRSERFDEVRTPNPLGPGEILVSRRYVGTFHGSVSFAAFAPGVHTLATRAFDPAGNATKTNEIQFEIVAAVDKDPPRVTISLDGTPDDLHVVAGSTVRARVSAYDDGVIEALTLTLDGEAIALPPELDPAASVGRTVSITLPALPRARTREP